MFQNRPEELNGDASLDGFASNRTWSANKQKWTDILVDWGLNFLRWSYLHIALGDYLIARRAVVRHQVFYTGTKMSKIYPVKAAKTMAVPNYFA
jgi:hypothetical protein